MLLAPLLSVAAVAAVSVSTADPNVLIRRHVAPLDQRAAVEGALMPAAEFTSSLVARIPRTNAKRSLLSTLMGRKDKHEAFTNVVDRAQFDYVTNITIGGQSFLATIDSGRCILVP